MGVGAGEDVDCSSATRHGVWKKGRASCEGSKGAEERSEWKVGGKGGRHDDGSRLMPSLDSKVKQILSENIC